MFTFLHTLHNPEITVYAATHDYGVDLYFFKGNPSDPHPSQAMAVVENASEDNLIVTKIFDEEHIGDTESSAMHTLVLDVKGWQPKEE